VPFWELHKSDILGIISWLKDNDDVAMGMANNAQRCAAARTRRTPPCLPGEGRGERGGEGARMCVCARGAGGRMTAARAARRAQRGPSAGRCRRRRFARLHLNRPARLCYYQELFTRMGKLFRWGPPARPHTCCPRAWPSPPTRPLQCLQAASGSLLAAACEAPVPAAVPQRRPAPAAAAVHAARLQPLLPPTPPPPLPPFPAQVQAQLQGPAHVRASH
jgi:hypothetical protein